MVVIDNALRWLRLRQRGVVEYSSQVWSSLDEGQWTSLSSDRERGRPRFAHSCP